MHSVSEEKIEASYLSKVFMGLIDVVLALLSLTLVFVYLLPKPVCEALCTINSWLLALIGLVIYRLLSFTFFNRTIGMKIFNVCLLNSDLRPLSFIEKLLASVFILYKGVDYYKK
jgi:uncharacterized RDD family membrane protein YckC